jgi:serine/threonine protein kinase
MPFNPAPNEEVKLSVDGTNYRLWAAALPTAPNYVHASEGRKASVYRLLSNPSANWGNTYALKVMKKAYQLPELESICKNLDQFKAQRGLRVCHRSCFTKAGAAAAIHAYSDLEYSILMPWIEGTSWFDALILAKNHQLHLTQKQSFTIAGNLCSILEGMERAGMAHCDLSGPNIMFRQDTCEVELIDVEDLYAPGFRQPADLGRGTDGYQHKTSVQGQWNPLADRFAGAILFCEMLSLWDPQTVRLCYDESFFDPAELQTSPCKRLNVIKQAVAAHSDRFLPLIDRCWQSSALSECPSFSEWMEVFRVPSLPFVVEPFVRAVNQSQPYQPTFEPIAMTADKPAFTFGQLDAEPESEPPFTFEK